MSKDLDADAEWEAAGGGEEGHLSWVRFASWAGRAGVTWGPKYLGISVQTLGALGGPSGPTSPATIDSRCLGRKRQAEGMRGRL